MNVLRLLASALLLAACSTATLTTPAEPGDGAAPEAPIASEREAGAPVDAATGHDGSTGPTGPIALVVEPSDKASALLAAVEAAKTSIHITMYLLNDTRFIDAFIAQKNAGLDVKVILNESFPTSGPSNATTYAKLQTAGVSVVWAPSSFTLTHEKCVILDGASAWIMTMNLESSSSQNREYLVVDGKPDDVAEAEAIFEADFSGQSITPTGSLVVSPVGSRDALLSLIGTAKTSIDLEGEELSDTKIVGALVAAEAKGTKVRVVLAHGTSGSSAQTTAIAQLKAAHVAVVGVTTPYIHAKALVVDGARAYVGSENFSTASLLYNRELGVVLDDASAVGTVRSTIAKDLADGTAL